MKPRVQISVPSPPKKNMKKSQYIQYFNLNSQPHSLAPPSENEMTESNHLLKVAFITQ
jgi:hypothetical protein